MAALAALAAACSPGGAEISGAAAAALPAQGPAAAGGTAPAHTPIRGAPDDYDPLLAAIGDARFVLLGESTHGTHEFYRERARISERLVREKGVLAVAVEGDWPDADRVNRYVRGLGSDASAEQALADFKRFPQWMWRNAEFAAFAERLRAWNLTRPAGERVGVYGMDVYNLYEAADATVAWLQRADPGAATRARTQYRCFARYGRDAQAYGEAARRPSRSCEQQAAAVLAEIRGRPRPSEPAEAEAYFAAVRSAASVAAAEAYFRATYAGAYSWNVRDRAMAETVTDIAAHVGALSGREGKVVVWAHNTHSGDARHTQATERGELNIGQLLRQRTDGGAFLVGFMTYAGTVMAAPEWDGRARVYTLRPALPESYAGLFHARGMGDALMVLRGKAGWPPEPRLERAVGVIYRPEIERQAHYFEARLSGQFDAVAYFDRTRAVTPLR